MRLEEKVTEAIYCDNMDISILLTQQQPIRWCVDDSQVCDVITVFAEAYANVYTFRPIRACYLNYLINVYEKIVSGRAVMSMSFSFEQNFQNGCHCSSSHLLKFLLKNLLQCCLIFKSILYLIQLVTSVWRLLDLLTGYSPQYC